MVETQRYERERNRKEGREESNLIKLNETQNNITENSPVISSSASLY